MAAILCTCFGLKYAVFKKKINPFEAVNRKNNFLEALDSENGGNWRDHALFGSCRTTMQERSLT